MSDTITFTIQGDSEGFVTFECPFCSSEFKLKASEYQCEKEPIEELFCPYCGLTKGLSNFFSTEVREHINALVYNYMAETLNKSFGKMSRSTNRSKGLIKITYKPLKKISINELKDKDTTEAEFKCTCCEHSTKVLYCAGVSKIFCPYCGVDI